ncbi:polarity protein BemA [Purpureocillium lavendulum]|uniref:Polarity protein BemA n=1 Tax=Purpureocillium lavendulum TaxID=1247861 RepID=A0AB34G699_9HYPO|nr:polarity protein BemA [Purpureocillium lavendulum]
MAPTRPCVLLLSLNMPPWFSEMYAPLLDAAAAKANVTHAQDAPSAVRLLEERSSAVLVTDEALTLPENAHVWQAVLGYVRRGGVAVVMGTFSSFARYDDIKPFFAQAGLLWEAGAYTRETFALDKATVDEATSTKLLPEYSQKALFVKNVAPAEAWYKVKPDEDSDDESSVSAPKDTTFGGSTAVALGRVGAGKVGYIGDVNAEIGSDIVVLAMCGLV